MSHRGACGPAINALVAGTVDVGLVIPVQAKQLIEVPAVFARGDHGREVSRVLPDVPMLAEVGINATAVTAHGLLARRKPTRDRRSLETDARRHDERQGFNRSPLCHGLRNPAADRRPYRDFIAKDLEKWRAVAKAGNIKIEK